MQIVSRPQNGTELNFLRKKRAAKVLAMIAEDREERRSDFVKWVCIGKSCMTEVLMLIILNYFLGKLCKLFLAHRYLYIVYFLLL